jgi:hypothetical protein
MSGRLVEGERLAYGEEPEVGVVAAVTVPGSCQL